VSRGVGTMMLIGVGKGEPFCAGNTNTRVAT
jgi:hypothetical protein